MNEISGISLMNEIGGPVLIFAAGIALVVVVAALFIGINSIIWQSKADGEPETSYLPAKQLHFAAVTITGLGLIFALSMAMYYWGPPPSSPDSDSHQKIFEACSTIIPPIITLILGYYFGKGKS